MTSTRNAQSDVPAGAREFDLGDILSITTGRLVSSRGMDGVYDILNFMTGDELFTHALPRAGDECTPFLFAQFPELKTMDLEVASLDAKLKGADRSELEGIVTAWVARQAERLGKARWVVVPLPQGQHLVKDPVTELVDIRAGARHPE